MAKTKDVDRLDRVVRILGGRRMSVSGIIENIVRHHLSLYEEDSRLGANCEN